MKSQIQLPADRDGAILVTLELDLDELVSLSKTLKIALGNCQMKMDRELSGSGGKRTAVYNTAASDWARLAAVDAKVNVATAEAYGVYSNLGSSDGDPF